MSTTQLSGALASHHRHPRPVRWIVLAILVLLLLGTLLPLGLAFLNAFKTPADYAASGPVAWPTSFTLDGVTAFWRSVDFGTKLWNSIVISTCVALLGVTLSVLSAYAIGIGRIRGRGVLLALFIVGLTLPQEALVYPLYALSKQVGLYDSKIAIIILFAVLQSAFGTYFISSVLTAFPREILEAAKMDGAGRLRILVSVVLPVLRPTLMVLATFFFIWTWNEFFIPLVMLTSNATQTVPIALSSLQGDRMMDAPTTNAGALVSLLPALIFFLIFQRTLTRGVTAGSVK